MVLAQLLNAQLLLARVCETMKLLQCNAANNRHEVLYGRSTIVAHEWIDSGRII